MSTLRTVALAVLLLPSCSASQVGSADGPSSPSRGSVAAPSASPARTPPTCWTLRAVDPTGEVGRPNVQAELRYELRNARANLRAAESASATPSTSASARPVDPQAVVAWRGRVAGLEALLTSEAPFVAERGGLRRTVTDPNGALVAAARFWKLSTGGYFLSSLQVVDRSGTSTEPCRGL